ncbi:MAG TPA: HlyD family efflux transporter periplasmic adaptor subunit [Paracoccaceae bacterium]|nr:HlyD family efflux transporter periplasmic adaptor subunit [Paracoccaceae bacterium]
MAWARGIGVAAVTGGVGLALIWAMWPRPVAVDLVTVEVAPMEVTVAAEGITRVRHTYVVTAPTTGTTARSPVEVGDTVVQGETVVAVIQPAEPAFLDARARAQAEAAVTEAQAAVRLAEVQLAQAEADLAYATAQADRNRALAERGTIPLRVQEDSDQRAATAAAAVEAARFDLDLHRATLARMEAQLRGPAPEAPAPGDCCLRLTAPQGGTVLEVADPNARLVQAGMPLVTIGDLSDLRIEVDLLSSDAVRVAPDMPARVDRWGGPGDLAARVERVDPSGFTRVSALGIEEQRVRVTLALDTPPESRAGLGDRFRVNVRIVTWQAAEVLQVPQSALFRQGDGWAVLRESEGRAALALAQVGQANDTVVEVLSGLSAGDRVIAYPGNRVVTGDRIAPRAAP